VAVLCPFNGLHARASGRDTAVTATVCGGGGVGGGGTFAVGRRLPMRQPSVPRAASPFRRGGCWPRPPLLCNMPANGGRRCLNRWLAANALARRAAPLPRLPRHGVRCPSALRCGAAGPSLPCAAALQNAIAATSFFLRSCGLWCRTRGCPSPPCSGYVAGRSLCISALWFTPACTRTPHATYAVTTWRIKPGIRFWRMIPCFRLYQPGLTMEGGCGVSSRFLMAADG